VTVPKVQYGGLEVLRRFAGRSERVERCELCAAALPEEHSHLLETERARIVCACGPCSLLFAEGERYRRVPQEVRRLAGLQIDDALWRSLAVPIELAFFFYSGRTKMWSAVYPSPAGPMQSPIDEEAWNEFAALDPSLQTLVPDVEAFLVDRLEGARKYFIAPIDECYKLTGLVRRHWRGFSGGDEAWQEIGEFFEGLECRATSMGGAHA
jgi:hypothetical protein